MREYEFHEFDEIEDVKDDDYDYIRKFLLREAKKELDTNT
jgi:hypothetical protein